MPHRTHSYIHIQTLEIKGEGMSKAYFIYINKVVEIVTTID